jgi:predicted signal transduction protein with EAL and GGDEF domain
VAEGVESEATAARLVELECDDLQGFWFARPMIASEVLGWASEHAASRTTSAAAASAASVAPATSTPRTAPGAAPAATAAVSGTVD